MTVRRQAREIALQVLFQREFSQQLNLMENLKVFRQSFSATEEVWSYSEELLRGVDHSRAQIDQQLTQASAHWSLERMALVDISLMRIAAFEMIYSKDPVPPKVAINEALEICKKYSTGESAAFINGVLDQLSKNCGLGITTA